MPLQIAAATRGNAGATPAIVVLLPQRRPPFFAIEGGRPMAPLRRHVFVDGCLFAATFDMMDDSGT